jgi:hypothetical protein
VDGVEAAEFRECGIVPWWRRLAGGWGRLWWGPAAWGGRERLGAGQIGQKTEVSGNHRERAVTAAA